MDLNYLLILVLSLIENQDLLSLALSLLSIKQKRIVARLCAIILLLALIVALLPKEITETKLQIFLSAETNYEHYEAEMSFQVLKQTKL